MPPAPLTPGVPPTMLRPSLGIRPLRSGAFNRPAIWLRNSLRNMWISRRLVKCPERGWKHQGMKGYASVFSYCVYKYIYIYIFVLNGVQKGSHTKKCCHRMNGLALFPCRSRNESPTNVECWPQHGSRPRLKWHRKRGAPSTSHPPIPRLASAKCCRQPQMLYVSRPEASE